MTEPEPARAPVDPDVAAELPGLELWTLEAEGGDGRAAKEIRRRLRDLSSRWTGARAVALRSQAVTGAYLVAFRQLGLDPDETRTPAEEAVAERLQHGGFPSRGRIADAVLLAVAETGVAVWAVDAARVSGELELRPARDGERLGEGPLAPDLPRGRLVVADAAGPLAVVFGPPAPDRAPGKATTRCLLFAVRVAGVPELHVEEALWIAADALVPGR
ncbi:MAG TPA: hypothetical protein VD931_10515 [Baekduia sp.]|nr:hypothetical protein [Baekduia sp.]